MENINIKCSNCKRITNITDFKKNGKVLKTCIKCRMSFIKSQNKKKCLHNRKKSQCIECHGSSICEHNRIKNTCILCNGSSICEHKKRKNRCKICSDEIKITIDTMICSSKHNDKKYNRYDIVNFIDKCFLKNLIEDSENKCFYCKCQLQYMIKQSNLATIERINNKLGHIKSNVVIACHHCNVSRVGNKLN